MARFTTTRWSIFLRARGASGDARIALDDLCRIYRAPVLAYIRSHGHAHDAEDLTQSFFIKFIDDALHAIADPAQGRFRAFLLTALKRFLIKSNIERRTQKRGGLVEFKSLDQESDNAEFFAGDETPDQAFERSWALSVLEAAVDRLRDEAHSGGKLELFEQLSPFLIERPDESDYVRIGEKFGLRANTVAVAVHRLRQRLRDLIRDELSQTAATPEDLNAELRELRSALVAVMS